MGGNSENLTGFELWNKRDIESVYTNNKALYVSHVLEQYKIYVEMADRISQRRSLTNVFFLTLNSSAIMAIGFYFKILKENLKPMFLLVPILGVVICLTWWWLLRSYRILNSAKYKVIGYLEQKLPSSPYWSAEWNELGEGRSLNKYLPLTKLEQFVPIIFVLLYFVVLFLI